MAKDRADKLDVLEDTGVSYAQGLTMWHKPTACAASTCISQGWGAGE